MKSKIPSSLALVAALSLGFTHNSDAEITLLFSQDGPDVVLTATGSLSLVGLTKSVANASLGATNFLDTVNEQLQIGSGVNAGVDRFTLVVKNSPFASASNIVGTLDSWSSNSNSIRFQQNNGLLLVDDALVAGDILTVNARVTFASRVLADFGLTAGTNVVFLENDSDGDAPAADGQVIVTTVAEQPSDILITSFTSLGVGEWGVGLTGKAGGSYEFYSAPDLVFDSGVLIENLAQGDPGDPGSVGGVNNSVLTLDENGLGLVRLSLGGDPRAFIRAQITPENTP